MKAIQKNLATIVSSILSAGLGALIAWLVLKQKALTKEVDTTAEG
jgi:hypothetical protein